VAVVSPCREALGSLPKRAKPLPGVASGYLRRRKAVEVRRALTRNRRGPGCGISGPLEEGGDEVKSVRPLCSGLHTCYSGPYKECRSREAEVTPKNGPRFGLQSATRLHEA